MIVENYHSKYSFDHILQINCIFCFLFSWFLCSCFHLQKCPWNNEEASGSWNTEHEQDEWVLLHLFPPQPSLIPAFLWGKEQKIHSCAPIFQQKPCSRLALAGTKWLKRMGWGEIAPCPNPLQCWEELAAPLLCVVRALLSREDNMCYFYEAKSIQNWRDVCVVGFNGVCLVGNPKYCSDCWCHTALQWHWGCSCTSGGGNSTEPLWAWKHKEINDWRAFKITLLCGSWKWRCFWLVETAVFWQNVLRGVCSGCCRLRMCMTQHNGILWEQCEILLCIFDSISWGFGVVGKIKIQLKMNIFIPQRLEF